MGLKLKIITLAIVPLLVAMLGVALLLVRQAHRLRDEQVNLIETSLMNEKRSELTHAVMQLENQLLALIASEPDVASAQRRAKDLIDSAYYGADGYFFANDNMGIILVHPRKPELVGKNMWNWRDSSGKYVHREIFRAAHAGGGFVSYLWDKPSSHEPTEKLSYVRVLWPWDWTLGCGVYLDDVQRATETARRQSAETVARTMWLLAAAALLAIGVVFAGTMLLNVTEQRLADTKLRRLNLELVGLNRRVDRVRERERARVSSELHDGISQQLAGTKYHFELARAALAERAGPAVASIERGLTRLAECIGDVRRISHELRPSELDDLGLAAALCRLTDDVADRSGIEVSLCHDMLQFELSDLQSLTLFRIAQEAMTNVERHAAARRVEVKIDVLGDGHTRRVRLRVTDDGRGFDPEIIDRPDLAGLGLRSIRQRVEEQRGTFRLRSRPGWTELSIDLCRARPA